MKKYILYGSLVIGAIFTVPLFWMKLMQWAFLDNTVIIAESISFTGAILGGVISGVLTLLGVKITIKTNEREKTLNAIPKKIMMAENIIYELRIQKNLLNKSYETVDYIPFMTERLKFIVEFFEKDGFLKESADVNYRFYKATRRMYESSVELLKGNKGMFILVDYLEVMENELNAMEIEVKKLISILYNG